MTKLPQVVLATAPLGYVLSDSQAPLGRPLKTESSHICTVPCTAGYILSPVPPMGDWLSVVHSLVHHTLLASFSTSCRASAAVEAHPYRVVRPHT